MLNLRFLKIVCLCWSPFDTAYHHTTCLYSCQGWNMRSLRFTHMSYTSTKRGLAFVKRWIMKSVVLCWSSFDTAYHHKTPSGSCQGRNMQRIRFTHMCCTSLKRGLALVKLWIMKSVVFVGLRSIPRIIIKHSLASARDEICKIVHLHALS